MGLETVCVVVWFGWVASIITVILPADVVEGEEGEVGVTVHSIAIVCEGHTEDHINGFGGVVEPLLETIW
jgi:hypothetical protein